MFIHDILYILYFLYIFIVLARMNYDSKKNKTGQMLGFWGVGTDQVSKTGKVLQSFENWKRSLLGNMTNHGVSAGLDKFWSADFLGQVQSKVSFFGARTHQQPSAIKLLEIDALDGTLLNAQGHFLQATGQLHLLQSLIEMDTKIQALKLIWQDQPIQRLVESLPKSQAFQATGEMQLIYWLIKEQTKLQTLQTTRQLCVIQAVVEPSTKCQGFQAVW